ncbi:MAG: hypothetical protein MK209_07010 [Planctomycetes bacterium]|nr:hypothetical protein [Planctomycetota bacterium]
MRPQQPTLPIAEAVRAFEARLQRHWASQSGAPPAGLRGYRAAWVQQFAESGEVCSAPEFLAACRDAELLLVSDFHPLARSTRMLARLLREVAWKKAPRLVLELLPAGVRVEANDRVAWESLRLIDGRRLLDTAPELLDAAAACAAELVGAWKPGTPAQRDEIAAQAWTDRRLSSEPRPEVLFFGDWHLAGPHLPRSLAQRGAKVTSVHQSPAPLWSRVRPHEEEPILRLADDHYAWMHTPPLAFWASARQGEGRSSRCDANAQLVEELAQGIAEILDLPAPPEAPEVLDARAWPGFWRSMPESHRAALDPNQIPRVAMVHPHESLIWAPADPSWNQLVDAAAGIVSQGSCLTNPANLGPWIAFRRIWARTWNPFLPTRDRGQLAADLGLCTGLARLRAAEASASYLDTLANGEAVAATMRRHPLLDRAALRTLLREGRHAFIWHLGMSTIQASPLSA